MQQFGGDGAVYSSPLNSYLPAVLETRRGIPITLALIYKAVAERVGLEVDGINLPGPMVTGAAAYAVIYDLILLTLAVVVFSRRNFK